MTNAELVKLLGKYPTEWPVIYKGQDVSIEGVVIVEHQILAVVAAEGGAQ